MVNDSASKLSAESHTLSSGSKSPSGVQIKRAVREQHEDREPARNQRLAAAAPEFERGGPGVSGDSAGQQQAREGRGNR